MASAIPSKGLFASGRASKQFTSAVTFFAVCGRRWRNIATTYARELERFVVKCRVKIEMDDEIRLWASHIVHFRVEYVDQNQYVEEALVGECASTAESGVSTVPGGAELLHRPPAFQNQEVVVMKLVNYLIRKSLWKCHLWGQKITVEV
ncbi:uncharacterized protein LOC18427610 isoform X7 [Amborella trichopoda]|uniref:uncharacterized protein LOC18427610 isoform X7 n=1 Tax=Amborella trichopoda TaxID=13333 RepID=UPI0009C06CFC|nr:uncharacterized protein LOC18427610 isoform X7 [Amborella trichopoda]|eukprot:XP_020518897.1 uncharacterized protein LOC18427610 isoform X7 [Amborella trichopoda]